MITIRTTAMDFALRLQAVIEADALERARASVMTAMGIQPPKRLGRPPKALPGALAAVRRSAPKQMCPVPCCRNPAAPIFGMFCAKHQDVAKSKIRQYREARKAKKLNAAA